MGTILDEILEVKRKENLRLKESSFKFTFIPKPKRSFIEKLEFSNEIALIAEFKRASPSKGIINNNVDAKIQAQLYEKNGASAISVLTDSTFFKGSFTDLRTISEAVNLPVLCKDFIIDSIQIDYAAQNGSDLILLIAAALSDIQLFELYHYARELGLEVLVEVHNQQEVERALKLGARLIGINNRDLTTFTVTLEITEKLASFVKQSGAFLISESGIHGPEDVQRVRLAGVNGILVGEALMRSQEVNKTIKSFQLPLMKEVEK